MRSHQSPDGRRSRLSRRFLRSYVRPFALSPFEDVLATVLMVGGWVFLASMMWFVGRVGYGFDSQPDLGGYGWLIVGLMLLVAAFSALWASRRVAEQGTRAVFLWLRVRRMHDDGQSETDDHRPDEMPYLILFLGSGFVGAALANLWTSGHYFDTSPVPWLIAGVLLVGTAVWTIWVHRRILAYPPSTSGVEYIRDGPAKTAASITQSFVMLAAWIAGLAGIPTRAGADLPPAFFVALLLGASCAQLSITRTKHLAKSQAVAVTEPEPA